MRKRTFDYFTLQIPTGQKLSAVHGMNSIQQILQFEATNEANPLSEERGLNESLPIVSGEIASLLGELCGRSVQGNRRSPDQTVLIV